MSQRGICSRREAEYFIDMKKVLVNGKLIEEQGTRVSVDSSIELIDDAEKYQKNKVVILLNKPFGVVSTQPEKKYVAAIELITMQNQYRIKNSRIFEKEHLQKLSVAGRLDVDSTGLLVLSQDGVIVKKIIGPKSEMEKEYFVKVSGAITKEKIAKLRFGLSLDGELLKDAQVEILNANNLRFILTEGKKRQIRRMCEMVELKVVSLNRVRIGNIKLGDLPLGKWRYLSEGETFQ